MGGILLPYLGIGGSNIITPNQIPGLQLWYDAALANATNFDPVPTNGGQVTAWKDKMILGRDANQPTATRRPLWQASQQNGYGTIQFDGTNDVLTLNPIDWALALPGQTTYIVVKANALSGIPRVTSTNTAGYQFFWDTTWGIETAGGRAKSAFAGNTTTYQYMGMVLDGTQTNPDITTQNNLRLKMRINGSPQTLTFSTNVGTTTSPTATGLFVGGDAQPPTNPFNGYIGEMMIWTRTLTFTEQLQVETYLSDKWAI